MMSDPNEKPENRPEEEYRPSEQEPRDRLRRLIAAGEEDSTQPVRVRPEPAESQEGSEPAADTVPTGAPLSGGPVRVLTAADEVTSGPAGLEESPAEEVKASSQTQEAPVDMAGAPAETGEDSAQPEAEPAEVEAGAMDTAGEPAADAEQPGEAGELPPQAPVEPEVNTQILSRHPTGDPDATGGWFGQDLSTPDDVTRPVTPEGKPVVPPEADPDATRPIAAPREDPGKTRPVSVSPTDQTRPVPAPRPPSQTRPSQRPPQDPSLPNRVEEIDPNATRVTPAAYRRRQAAASRAETAAPGTRQPVWKPEPPTRGTAVPPRPPQAAAKKRSGVLSWGCLLRLMIGFLFAGVIAVIVALIVGVVQYYSIASSLPSVDDLRSRASQFETTRILDSTGDVIYEIIDPNAGKRTYVPLERISPYLIAATLATEDKDFYTHPGYDPVAIARALVQNYTSGATVSGASTITQQLARALLLPEERFERNVQRKAREIVLAAEITRQYSKEEILELYLNENFYGKMAYGIEAAAETYFNTTADQLTLGQAAFLAGLPQSPSVYDIETNRPATLERFRQVLVLMYQLSEEDGCIYVAPNQDRVCVTAEMAAQAVEEIASYQYAAPENTIRFPHWVDYIRAQLESQFDPQTIYRSGFTVFTTLDPVLQEEAERIVAEQVSSLADRNVSSGALVAIRPDTGEILAMVGSADFYNEAISGQVNMTVQPRQPGSTMKPLTYAAAFEKGWTPATLIWDIPSEFPPSGDPNDPSPKYEPVNYDGRFHGPVTVCSALANSYNIPAVKALQFVGIYDDPNTSTQEGLISFARRLGITTLNRSDYGLSLTLGGGEVTLLEMTSAYGAFANGGRRVQPVAITRIVDHEGNLVYEYQPAAGEQVIRAEHAYLINSILSDNEARTPMFGANSPLNLPFQAAVKTGTTNDFRDNWTIGYTPDLAVGVWVGNADYTPMEGTTGTTGAAPIWSQFTQFAVPYITGGSPTPFSRPPGVVERIICESSGTEPSERCPMQRLEYFAFDQLPLPKEQDLWQRISVDTWTGLRASAGCSDYMEEQDVINVTDQAAREWITGTEEGRAWASSLGISEPIRFTPERECTLEDPRPRLLFANLQQNQTITESPLDIYVIANATADFRHWRLDYGLGEDPSEWRPLLEGVSDQYENPQMVYSWDLHELPAGVVTLRLRMESNRDTFAEKTVTITLQVPTPTPTPEPTATITPTPEPTETPTIARPLETVSP